MLFDDETYSWEGRIFLSPKCGNMTHDYPFYKCHIACLALLPYFCLGFFKKILISSLEALVIPILAHVPFFPHQKFMRSPVRSIIITKVFSNAFYVVSLLLNCWFFYICRICSFEFICCWAKTFWTWDLFTGCGQKWNK